MKADKRSLFLKVGEQLFNRYGYRQVSITAITRAAGVGTGSFYTYFPSKEAFYDQILDGIEERGIREVDRLIEGLQSPLNKLKALYRFATLGIKRSPLLLGVMTGNRKYLFPRLQQRLERKDSLRGHIEETITEILKEGSRKLVFRSGLFKNPKRLTLAIFDAILMNLESERVEELMDDALLLIERGLRRRIRLRPGLEQRERRKIIEQEP